MSSSAGAAVSGAKRPRPAAAGASKAAVDGSPAAKHPRYSISEDEEDGDGSDALVAVTSRRGGAGRLVALGGAGDGDDDGVGGSSSSSSAAASSKTSAEVAATLLKVRELIKRMQADAAASGGKPKTLADLGIVGAREVAELTADEILVSTHHPPNQHTQHA